MMRFAGARHEMKLALPASPRLFPLRRHVLYPLLLLTSSVSLACLPDARAIDARVRDAMAVTRANGMAIAVIDGGRVAYVQNDVRAEARFGDLVRFVLGETGVPYDWEYADRAGKS
jgi:CubicO group peptidase (beta-lactamase class C family)